MSKYQPSKSLIHLGYALIPVICLGALIYLFVFAPQVAEVTPIFQVTDASTAIVQTLQGEAPQNTFIRANQLLEPGNVANATPNPALVYTPVTLDGVTLGKTDLLKMGP